ncbi:hypothetical protein [Longimicrobium sp.]|uniref:hypothetical protein n=1 Tax=Longimicrobium sp. TaxID=2029185 RepID=UPI002E310E95|nr:hypothetical protein [Longimicrobium sp.]HEX6037899.1 hypothetical protein [Longimicrobium sp.]
MEPVVLELGIWNLQAEKICNGTPEDIAKTLTIQESFRTDWNPFTATAPAAALETELALRTGLLTGTGS